MEYIIPEKIEDIEREIGNKRAYYLAGGTDLMVKKKENEIDDYLPWVDLSRLEKLKGIFIDEEFLYIGALTTMAELAENDMVIENAKTLSEAASIMGSPLIRNLATIGGNIANANPAGDTLPPLYALDAIVNVQKGAEKKEIPICELCTGPGDNVLECGEIITMIKIPVTEKGRSIFLKLGPRKALAISKVSLAVWWQTERNATKDIRIAMGAVGPRCLRAKKTEEMMRGERLTAELLKEAVLSIQYEPTPITDFRSTEEYRREMIGVLFNRAIKKMMVKI
ncbi:FAD binding domain-containing protein [Elusimicrobiota bacterium]